MTKKSSDHLIFKYWQENMKNKNIVFIAKSLDGYIADKNGGLEWLHSIPNPDNIDMGYTDMINRIDAVLLGRITFEVICGFDIDWPYNKPVFVLSTTLKKVPVKLIGKVEFINGSIKEIVKTLNEKGFHKLYIDGGTTINSFLEEDLIDEMILTTIPILLGGGIPLFKDFSKPLEFEHIKSEVFLDAIVQDTFCRKK
jgi:dihydrofolate reductase